MMKVTMRRTTLNKRLTRMRVTQTLKPIMTKTTKMSTMMRNPQPSRKRITPKMSLTMRRRSNPSPHEASQ